MFVGIQVPKREDRGKGEEKGAGGGEGRGERGVEEERGRGRRRGGRRCDDEHQGAERQGCAGAPKKDSAPCVRAKTGLG